MRGRAEPACLFPVTKKSVRFSKRVEEINGRKQRAEPNKPATSDTGATKGSVASEKVPQTESKTPFQPAAPDREVVRHYLRQNPLPPTTLTNAGQQKFQIDTAKVLQQTVPVPMGALLGVLPATFWEAQLATAQKAHT